VIRLDWKSLCFIFLDVGIFMKVVGLIEMCLNRTYSKFPVGTPLCGIFPTQSGLKQGDGLSPWLFNFVLYRGADKSLARPGRKEATATEDFDFHISYL